MKEWMHSCACDVGFVNYYGADSISNYNLDVKWYTVFSFAIFVHILFIGSIWSVS